MIQAVFKYGTIPDEPTHPDSCLVYLPGCGELLMLISDLGLNPVPYILVDLETGERLKDPPEKLLRYVERYMTEKLGFISSFRN